MPSGILLDAVKAKCTHLVEEAGRQMKLLEQTTNSKLLLRSLGLRFNYPKPAA